MSLHRVASIETWERSRDSSPGAEERRKLTFNPIGPDSVASVEGQPEQTSAIETETTRTKKLCLLLVYVFLCLIN